jgi:phthalate 4,5-dioxygenase oxygenase subunit
MWTTIGPIADRTKEHLGAGDLAVVEFRRQMLDAVRRFQQGEAAIGTGDQRIPPTVCSFQGVYSKAVDWRTLEPVPVGVERLAAV